MPLFLLFLIGSCLTTPLPVKAARNASEFVAASPHSIVIESPNNYAVYENLTQLKFTLSYLASDEQNNLCWQHLESVNYSLDGKPPVPVLIQKKSSSIHYVSTSLNLSNLPNGQHKIEVTAKFVADVDNLFVPTYDFTSEPVYFTVYNTPPPGISNLSLEKQNQTDVLLTFTVDKPTAWISYSIDEQENVTNAGNSTLTILSYGSHNTVVYANDTLGNMGSSKTLSFDLSSKEPFSMSLIAVLITSNVCRQRRANSLFQKFRKFKR